MVFLMVIGIFAFAALTICLLDSLEKLKGVARGAALIGYCVFTAAAAQIIAWCL